MLDTFLKVLSAVAIAALSSWITVYLSLNKFRSERWWEKKVQAYERVIEAFHKAKKFASEYLDAEYKGKEVDKDRDLELRRLSKEARDEIARASDIGSFVLSEDALKVIAKYLAEEEAMPRQESWYEYLEADWSLIDRFMKEFTTTAKRDLG